MQYGTFFFVVMHKVAVTFFLRKSKFAGKLSDLNTISKILWCVLLSFLSVGLCAQSALSADTTGQVTDTLMVTTDGDTLHMPLPETLTTAYELILLDGDTVLRNAETKEIFRKDFARISSDGRTLIKNDWLNQNWSNTALNPYKNTPTQFPLILDFSNYRYSPPIKGPITSRYGWRKGRAHKGIDIDLRTGDNVRAAMDGKVRIAKYTGGLGRLVVIRHYNGLETFYAHLSKLLVKPNDYVLAGQVVGKGGNTGRSSGSHLHFETRLFGHTIHPEYLFDFENYTGPRSNLIYVDRKWADPAKHRSHKKSTIVVRTQPLMASNLTIGSSPLITSTVTDSLRLAKPATHNSTPLVSQSAGSTSLKKNTPANAHYTIKKGDTLHKVAKRFNITVAALCHLNSMKKTDVLRVGQSLKVQ